MFTNDEIPILNASTTTYTNYPSKAPNFPLKLYDAIEAEDKIAIDWLPDGTAFKVKDVHVFRNEFLSKYFRHDKITSFTKQLNLYGFKRIATGDYKGSYSHSNFRRGERALVQQIKLVKEHNTSSKSIRRSASSTSSSSADSSIPDEMSFHEASQYNGLSCLIEAASIESVYSTMSSMMYTTNITSFENEHFEQPHFESYNAIVPRAKKFKTSFYETEISPL